MCNININLSSLYVKVFMTKLVFYKDKIYVIGLTTDRAKNNCILTRGKFNCISYINSVLFIKDQIKGDFFCVSYNENPKIDRF